MRKNSCCKIFITPQKKVSKEKVVNLKATIPNSLKTFLHSHITVGSAFVPNENDVMLVSYPKSGNTWMRALIANTIFPGISLHDMDRLLPNIYSSSLRDISKSHVFSFGGRLIKSHEAFRPFYGKTIYIYRDPRDVMISYFYYLKKRGKFSSSSFELKDFVEPFVHGNLDKYGSWYQNVKSWIELKKENILFISYESLLKDTKGGMIKVFEFLGEKIHVEVIDRALNLSSIETLRNREVSERKTWRESKHSKENVMFFRKGKAEQWRNYDQNIFKKVKDQWGDLMKKTGYMI